jgi:hypothetical protein
LRPTTGLVIGGAVIFSVAFLSLYSVIRSHVEQPKTPVQRIDMALAGGTAGLAPSTPVIAKANAAAAPEPPRPAPESPRGVWAMAAPPPWLASVDPGAAGVAAPFAAPRSNFELPPEDVALADVPLPRPRPRSADR